jgi:hypothetical protein
VRTSSGWGRTHYHESSPRCVSTRDPQAVCAQQVVGVCSAQEGSQGTGVTVKRPLKGPSSPPSPTFLVSPVAFTPYHAALCPPWVSQTHSLLPTTAMPSTWSGSHLGLPKPWCCSGPSCHPQGPSLTSQTMPSLQHQAPAPLFQAHNNLVYLTSVCPVNCGPQKQGLSHSKLQGYVSFLCTSRSVTLLPRMALLPPNPPK